MIMDNGFTFFLIFRLLLYQSSTLLSTYSNLILADLISSSKFSETHFSEVARNGPKISAANDAIGKGEPASAVMRGLSWTKSSVKPKTMLSLNSYKLVNEISLSI